MYKVYNKIQTTYRPEYFRSKQGAGEILYVEMKASTFLIGFVLFFAFLVLSAMLNGYALSVLWGWFIVPTFGLPQLSVVAAIGVAMVVGYLTNHQQPEKEDPYDDRSFGQKMGPVIALAVMKPIFALTFGWIVHLFM